MTDDDTADAEPLEHEEPDDDDGEGLPGRHVTPPDPGAGKGAWLQTLGLQPADLAGRIVTVAAYKGGVGKTMLAYELAYLLGAVLIDLDWDWGNASRAWGYREERRVTAPLLDALERMRAPRPLTGGPWRPDLVPCSSDFGDNQPGHEKMTDWLELCATTWAQEHQCPVVIDTHPGGSPSTFGAVAAAHLTVVPTILAEREMRATERLIGELKSYRLVVVPNKVTRAPAERYITQLERLASEAFVPVGPAVSEYRWLPERSKRMAVTAAVPTPKKHQPFVDELHEVAREVVTRVRTA